jgi:acetyltransferase-like isoleucine patch superfamily enzyme
MPSLTFFTTNSSGDKNMTTQVFTYLLKNDEIDLIASKGEYLNSTTVSSIKKYITKTIILSNEIIQPSDPFVSEVIGNQININANNFRIDGEISSTPGYNINLYYRENIEFGNNVVINPNISIEQKLDFFGSGTNEEATRTQLENFCSGNNKEYKADQLTQPWPITKQSDSVLNTSTKREFKITIAPNPSDAEISIFLYDTKDEQYDCSIYDLAGKRLKSIKIETHENKATEQFNTADLANGIYLVVVSNNNFRITKKLAIEHH